MFPGIPLKTLSITPSSVIAISSSSIALFLFKKKLIIFFNYKLAPVKNVCANLDRPQFATLFVFNIVYLLLFNHFTWSKDYFDIHKSVHFQILLDQSSHSIEGYFHHQELGFLWSFSRESLSNLNSFQNISYKYFCLKDMLTTVSLSSLFVVVSSTKYLAVKLCLQTDFIS